MIDDTIQIAENDKCIFYKNMMTKDYKDGYKIVLVKHKDTGYKEYLLIHKNKPLFSSQNIENVWFKYKAIKLIKSKS